MQFSIRLLLAATAFLVVALPLGWAALVAALVPVLALFLVFQATSWGGAVARLFLVTGMLAVVYLATRPGYSSINERLAETCQANLRLIALALNRYHDRYQSYPPAYLADEEGNPTHSWRALILPFLDEPALAADYRLDEPWDGPHNAALIHARPAAFACRPNVRSPEETSYLAVLGPHAAWAGSMPLAQTDLAADTVFVVEVADAGIAWSEPRDISSAEVIAGLASNAALRVSSNHGDYSPLGERLRGAHLLLADGTVVFLREGVAADALAVWLDRRTTERSPYAVPPGPRAFRPPAAELAYLRRVGWPRVAAHLVALLAVFAWTAWELTLCQRRNAAPRGTR